MYCGMCAKEMRMLWGAKFDWENHEQGMCKVCAKRTTVYRRVYDE